MARASSEARPRWLGRDIIGAIVDAHAALMLISQFLRAGSILPSASCCTSDTEAGGRKISPPATPPASSDDVDD